MEKRYWSEKNKTHTFQYSTGVTTLSGSDILTSEASPRIYERKTTQLCLLPRKLEKTTKFHKEIMEKNAPNYVKLIRKLKENVISYLSAGFTTKTINHYVKKRNDNAESNATNYMIV